MPHVWAALGDTLGVQVGSGISLKLSSLSDVSMGSRSCVYMHVHMCSRDHVCIYMCMCRFVIRCVSASAHVEL